MLFGILLLLVIFLAVCALVWGVQELRDEQQQSLKMVVKIMSAAFDDLKAQVAAQTSLDASAVTLIQGIADKLQNMGSGATEADLQALADELRTGAAPLAAAVTANTPAGGPQPT